MDSFLRCHQIFSKTPIPGRADEYIRLWAKSVKPLGLANAPSSEAEMLAEIARFQSELVVTEEIREIIHWIKNPPLPFTSIPIYSLLFKAALASLPANYRSLLGLGDPPLSIYQPVLRWHRPLGRFQETHSTLLTLARIRTAVSIPSAAWFRF